MDEPSKTPDLGAPVTLGPSRFDPETVDVQPVYTECPAEMAAT